MQMHLIQGIGENFCCPDIYDSIKLLQLKLNEISSLVKAGEYFFAPEYFGVRPIR